MYEKLYQAAYAEMSMMKKSSNPNKKYYPLRTPKFDIFPWSMPPNPNPRSMLGDYGSEIYPPFPLPLPPPPQPKSPRGPCLLFTLLSFIDSLIKQKLISNLVSSAFFSSNFPFLKKLHGKNKRACTMWG